jgi:hypothetical protein
MRVLNEKQFYEVYGVLLGACAFGYKISKSRNVV